MLTERHTIAYAAALLLAAHNVSARGLVRPLLEEVEGRSWFSQSSGTIRLIIAATFAATGDEEQAIVVIEEAETIDVGQILLFGRLTASVLRHLRQTIERNNLRTLAEVVDRVVVDRSHRSS